MAPSSCASSVGASVTLGNGETAYFGNNRHHQLAPGRQKVIHLQQSQQQQQQHHQQQQQGLSKRPEEVVSAESRGKASLETIDLSAITCDSLQEPPVDTKKSSHRPNRSPSQGVSPRSGGVAGVPYHDPLSVAFLHALVDPQQSRGQGECRPLVQPPSHEGMPFPSFSPGSMDTDLDHDNFLTNLLM